MLDTITPVILTRDEAPNIGRALEQLRWAREVVVVDSGSRDGTVSIAKAFPNVRVVERPLDDLAQQWTFAVRQASTEWVLTLDADYFVTAELVEEISGLLLTPEISAAECRFVYAVNGKPLRATLYPQRKVLLRQGASTFVMDGHTQRVVSNGRTVALNARIIHDDRKDFRSFVARQKRYMRDEAHKILSTPSVELPLSGRVRKAIVVAPLAVAVHTLLVQRLILDGTAGLRYAAERVIAEVILSGELIRQLLPTSGRHRR
jgi:glycosyltransferase involved in cell wall biosynthesis